jgi:hypothetical protein
MNIFLKLKELIPKDRIYTCTVVSELSDGTSTVTTSDGFLIVVVGVNGRASGSKVQVQGGRIVGDSPALPTYQVTV